MSATEWSLLKAFLESALQKKLRKVGILPKTSLEKSKKHCARTPFGAQVRSLSVNMTKMEFIRGCPGVPGGVRRCPAVPGGARRNGGRDVETEPVDVDMWAFEYSQALDSLLRSDVFA